MISNWRGSSCSKVRERPFFQSFGQQCVIGVGQSPSRNIPGFVPAEMRLVEQDPHQLGNRQGRMRVVQLDRDLVGNELPIPVAPVEAPNQIGKRTGNQEIFLHKAQCLPDIGAVVGIEYPRQGSSR